MFYSIVNDLCGYESRLFASYEEAEAYLPDFCAEMASIGLTVDPDFIFIDRAD